MSTRSEIDDAASVARDDPGLGVRYLVRRAHLRWQLPVVRMRDAWLLGPRGRNRLTVTDPDIDRDPPFFILGHPRSGTTLLRRIVNAHPTLFVPPENGALLWMMRAYGAHRGGDWPSAVEATLGCLPRGYEFEHWQLDVAGLIDRACALAPERRNLAALLDLVYRDWGSRQAAGGTRWGDKTTPGDFSYLYKLDRVFPTARYIEIVRDGRDSVASALKANLFENSAERAALAWRDNVRLCREFARTRSTRHHALTYEDLVSSPEDVIRSVCEFLGVDYRDDMLSPPSDATALPTDMRAIDHHRNVSRPIGRGSIGAWRDGIPSDMARRVMRLLGDELKRNGYPP